MFHNDTHRTYSYDSIGGLIPVIYLGHKRFLPVVYTEVHQGRNFLGYLSWEHRPMMLHMVCHFESKLFKFIQQVGKGSTNGGIVKFYASSSK